MKPSDLKINVPTLPTIRNQVHSLSECVLIFEVYERWVKQSMRINALLDKANDVSNYTLVSPSGGAGSKVFGIFIPEELDSIERLVKDLADFETCGLTVGVIQDWSKRAKKLLEQK